MNAQLIRELEQFLPAGSVLVTQPEASLEFRKEKMEYAPSTNAPIIATANPGCILQLRVGAQLHSTGQEVLHVVELLARAL